jgi:hypothetical protein
MQQTRALHISVGVGERKKGRGERENSDEKISAPTAEEGDAPTKESLEAQDAYLFDFRMMYFPTRP